MNKAVIPDADLTRYNPDCKFGLSDKQISQRKKDKLTNNTISIPTKTISRIFFENIFTLFNVLNFILALAIVCVGSYKNLLFIGVIICNILIIGSDSNGYKGINW